MVPATGQKIAYLICFAVISIAVTGYFIGLQAPMNPAFVADVNRGNEPGSSVLTDQIHTDQIHDDGVIAATEYAAMGTITRREIRLQQTSLTSLKTKTGLMDEVKIIPGQKQFALELREQNRAFNGAPPTIPHPVDPVSVQSCVVCHANGLKTESLRIPKMSHAFMTDCTQCHVEENPTRTDAFLFRPNSFVGLAAPTEGPRAFQGAPPQIPHSTWMRTECSSCHGPTGLQGMRSTHPWRTSCQQCHAPSSSLNQTELNPMPQFLSPPAINPSSENLQ